MALFTKQVTVGTAAVQVLEQDMNRIQVLLHNGEKSGNNYIWFGGAATVTTSTGAHLDNADTYQLVIQPGNELWAVTDAGTKTLHVLWQVV